MYFSSEPRSGKSKKENGEEKQNAGIAEFPAINSKAVPNPDTSTPYLEQLLCPCPAHLDILLLALRYMRTVLDLEFEKLEFQLSTFEVVVK